MQTEKAHVERPVAMNQAKTSFESETQDPRQGE
jgi:hypothetical protein